MERRRDGTRERTTVGFFRRDVRQVASAIPDTLAWCRTTRCPKCRAPGHLDRIDLVDSTTSQHCDVCGHRWQTYGRGPGAPRLA